jgi:hypothetical protein
MKTMVSRLLLALVLVTAVVLWWRSRSHPPDAVPGRKPSVEQGRPGDPLLSRPNSPAVGDGRPPSPEEKAARVAQIRRDYDDIRAKASAEFAAAGTNYPGGLNAFLRQLALLEREKRRDLAAVLEPGELEDLEMRESTAGQLVQRLLENSAATEAQRREVFRAQRQFEDAYALTFDLTPTALLERERMRFATQEKIRAVLGDAVFLEWLRGEGPDLAQMTEFTRQQGLPADAALNLWHAKTDLTIRRLEVAVRPGLTPEMTRQLQDQITRQAEDRVFAILGPGGMEAAKRQVLGWLPRN